MIDHFKISALAVLRHQELLEEAAKARLAHEGQLAARIEARRRERARRRAILSAGVGVAPLRPATLGGLRAACARALRTASRWLEGPQGGLRGMGLEVRR